MNIIKTLCICKRPVILTWEKREHLCECGVKHIYRPPAIRKSEEVKKQE